jgi:hypothetical protein
MAVAGDLAGIFPAPTIFLSGRERAAAPLAGAAHSRTGKVARRSRGALVACSRFVVFSRKFDRRFRLLVAVFLLSSVCGVAFGVYALWPGRREAGYEPDQPIRYSHRLHAGTLKIECRYCHWNVDTSPHVAVPRLSTCMKCHAQVQPKDSTGAVRREIAKLLAAWEKKEPVLWEKVHILADFCFFDHSRHIAAGLECRQCHGSIETMERVRRQNPMVMGWCLGCHRDPPPEAKLSDGRTRAPEFCNSCHR